MPSAVRITAGIVVRPARGASQTRVADSGSAVSLIGIVEHATKEVALDFPLETSGNITGELLADGSIAFIRSNGPIGATELRGRHPGSRFELPETVAVAARPWAVDADGTVLETHYELTEGNIRQIVNTKDATFPIAADPSFSLGWKGLNPALYIHFNRNDTVSMSTYSVKNMTFWAGWMCESAPSGLGWLCSKLLKARAEEIIWYSKKAVREGKCVSAYTAVGAEALYRWGAYLRKC